MRAAVPDVSRDEDLERRIPGIGLLNEKPLHASLKRWYARPGDRFEVPLDGYVVDIVRDDLLLEIQTSRLGSLKPKLATLVRSHRLRLIHPIAREKWIVRLASDGGPPVSRRKSPTRGRVEDLFWEAVGLARLFADRNLSLEIVMVREEEARRHEPGRGWRRRGWVTHERRLLEVVDRRVFGEPADWRALLPEGLESFTTNDLAQELRLRLELAQRMAYFLREAGIVTLIGKRGRAHLYAVSR
jgi:hypothetical protein